VIDAEHHVVVAARALAAADPVAAAGQLARLILVDTGGLDVTRSERLLAATLAALGVGS
jgi:hypothetical protein